MVTVSIVAICTQAANQVVFVSHACAFFRRHEGSFSIARIRDSTGHEFATRLGNVFVIGVGSRPWISLPKGKGIKLSILEERSVREQKSLN